MKNNGGGFVFNLGPAELILIFVVVLIIFGPGKLPEIGKGMGKAISEFKKSSSEIQKEITDSIKETDENNQK